MDLSKMQNQVGPVVRDATVTMAKAGGAGVLAYGTVALVNGLAGMLGNEISEETQSGMLMGLTGLYATIDLPGTVAGVANTVGSQLLSRSTALVSQGWEFGKGVYAYCTETVEKK